MLGRQMNRELGGYDVVWLEVGQEKCINLPCRKLKNKLLGKKIRGVRNRGKWVVADLDSHELAFNLGMGGELLLHRDGTSLPESHFSFQLSGGQGISLTFYWFGHVHLINKNDIAEHPIGQLGPQPLEEDLTMKRFVSLFAGRRGRLKNFLLNQKNIAGIGNAYIHDILFLARIHPLQDIRLLQDEDLWLLYGAIERVLRSSLEMGGLAFEKDLYGQHGGYGRDFFRVAYRDGSPCPACGNEIKKIKTGKNSSYICNSCQSLKN